MDRKEASLSFSCGVDIGAMPEVPGGRMCTKCQTVVHDLTSIGEEAARSELASADGKRLCVRYLYDVEGKVVFAGDVRMKDAAVIPESRLLRGRTSRGSLREHPLVRLAMLTAPLVLLEACGSAGLPEHVHGEAGDAGTVPAEPTVADASDDAADASSDVVNDAPSDANDAGAD